MHHILFVVIVFDEIDIWVSCKQSEITVSTMEAIYSGLKQCSLVSVVPLKVKTGQLMLNLYKGLQVDVPVWLQYGLIGWSITK